MADGQYLPLELLDLQDLYIRSFRNCFELCVQQSPNLWQGKAEKRIIGKCKENCRQHVKKTCCRQFFHFIEKSFFYKVKMLRRDATRVELKMHLRAHTGAQRVIEGLFDLQDCL